MAELHVHNESGSRNSTKSNEPAPNNSFSLDEETGQAPAADMLHRKLKARHIQMIAIGGNIGTGLFIGSGKALHTGGPLALVVGFFMVSVSLTMMMQCLGEMSVIFPIPFTRYASRFIDPALGFAVGWQYWLCWVSIFGAESSAFVILINYWNNDPHLTPLWISIFIVLNIAIHLAPVRVFGEVEFIVSSLKVVTVCVFIIIVWCIMGGAGPTGHRHGAEYWHLPGLDHGLNNGFRGLASVFVTAAFAAGGTETVGVVAGEAQNPRYNIPRAVCTLMWRVFIFYVVSMLFLTFVVRYDADTLVGGSNANSSPFVLAVRQAGILTIPDLLNAIIMVCVVSVGSTSIYTSSRTLKGLADEGFAFPCFKKTDQHGRPCIALVFSATQHGSDCVRVVHVDFRAGVLHRLAGDHCVQLAVPRCLARAERRYAAAAVCVSGDGLAVFLHSRIRPDSFHDHLPTRRLGIAHPCPAISNDVLCQLSQRSPIPHALGGVQAAVQDEGDSTGEDRFAKRSTTTRPGGGWAFGKAL
ncbi:hypothetical protein BP5796_08226 [Coleophoma crateriformis]|uniref:Amino acid permease/ SLC12A domain-containing protein n=1 Tax=Coleophoma crateriformis TaxID=565419 RepID=A0A3D8RDU2_9HELO|nr:hypothetical protein BP5796_08226 [Coleophoma crateriformis]